MPRIPTRLIVPFRYNVRFFFIAKIILNKKLKKYLSSYFVTFNVKKIRTKSRYSIFERIIDYFFFFFFFSIHRYSTARTKALKKYIINIKYPFFSFFFYTNNKSLEFFFFLFERNVRAQIEQRYTTFVKFSNR